jgi:hypothetical protein
LNCTAICVYGSKISHGGKDLGRGVSAGGPELAWGICQLAIMRLSNAKCKFFQALGNCVLMEDTSPVAQAHEHANSSHAHKQAGRYSTYNVHDTNHA